MNPETVYKISTAIMWICVGMNAWGVWCNYQTGKAYRALIKMKNEEQIALTEAKERYYQRIREFEKLRERLLNDDRTEDRP